MYMKVGRGDIICFNLQRTSISSYELATVFVRLNQAEWGATYERHTKSDYT